MPPTTLASPTTSSPARVPGSIRRTSHIDMTWLSPADRGPSGATLRLAGGARDLVTPTRGPAGGPAGGAAGEAASGAAAEVLREATISADVASDRSLVGLVATPCPAGLADLIGTRVGSGFRARLDASVAGERGTPLGLLLDDLPVAALISGYITMRTAAHFLDEWSGASMTEQGAAKMSDAVLDRMTDMCSGWRADGVAVVSIRRGARMPVQDCPPAPRLHAADPDGWHHEPTLGAGGMRRRRRIDVSRAAGLDNDRSVLHVDAMFRDTFTEPDGNEGVLHEYTLVATVDAETTELLALSAEPRVLPFPECPAAAANVARLVGTTVAEFRRAVPERLGGIDGCTHLNDLLRALADVGSLAGYLPPL